MRILLVVPRQKSMFGDGVAPPPHPNVGVAYLTSYLKSKGHSVVLYDEGVENDIGLEDALGQARADLVGVTVFSYCYNYAAEVIGRVKRVAGCPLVIGGPHVSAVGEQSLRGCSADFAIAGEGEISFLELIEALEAGETDFSRIDGLLWRKGSEVIKNSPRKPLKDLDSLPFPDYQSFGLSKYVCSEERMVPIITSRGCPFGCNYCSVKLTMGRNFRPRSPENVVAEIETWYKRGWTRFDINDDCFTLDIDRAASICDLIMKKGLRISYRLYNGIRVDRVTPELLLKMGRSGCQFVSYGCESANADVLRRIGKNITVEKVRQAVNWTNEAGIDNSVNFIIGHPGETYARALETIDFARSLPTKYVNFYNLVPYPGTALHEWVQANADMLVSPKTYLSRISYRDAEPVFETPDFPKEARKKALKKGFALYRRRVIQYRLGAVKGAVADILTRPKLVDRLARYLAFNNRIGRRFYVYLSSASRR